MKRFFLLSTLLILAVGCNFNNGQPNDSAHKKIVSDHEYLEEAKAIARELIEGSEKVEKELITRAEFEKRSRPLQKELNLLIMSLDKDELRQLEDYRNELLVKNAENSSRETGLEM